MRRFAITPQEREKLFHTELVKHGVSYQKAAQAAKILADGMSDEQLTEAEQQLVQEVCREWLKQRQRWSTIRQVLRTPISPL